MKMRRGIIVSLCLLLTLAGCAEGNSIYHKRTVELPFSKEAVGAQGTDAGEGSSAGAERAGIVSVDAKQRNLLVVRGAEGWKLCAEAAPDVFSAISASAALEANIKAQGGKAAAAIAETASTIERTQTVNLLRESMFRTCERWLSGALDKSSFIIQAARDQRTMLAVLAIEQLTRTVRPPSTIISADTTMAAVANSDSAALIKQFADERTAAEAAQKAAQIEFDDAKQASDCDSITVAPTDADALGKWTTCVQAREALAAKKAAATAANDKLNKIVNLGLASGSTAGSTGAGPNSNGGGGTGPSEPTIVAVAQAVSSIATAPGFDEVLMFCIANLSGDTTKLGSEIIKTCLEIMKTRQSNDERAREGILGISAVSRILNNVPADQIDVVEQMFRDGGANSVKRQREGDGKFTVTANFPDIKKPRASCGKPESRDSHVF